MQIGQIINSILSAKKGTISSKRVCGVLGWFVCLFILIWCSICQSLAPDFSDYVVITSASLLGIDSVMQPFNRLPKGKTKRYKSTEEEE